MRIKNSFWTSITFWRMTMKKNTFLILIISLILVVSGCRKNSDMEALQNAKPAESDETAIDYSMPSLPDMEYDDMDLFEDGYEIVEFRSLSDGDTATFEVGGLPMAVRFLAVDTPEINSSTTGLEPWAIAAKEYTRQKLQEADTIILELDPGSDIFDKYDRLLAWVWVDGELLNYKLVEEGLAYVKYLYGDYKYTLVLIKLEAQAQRYGGRTTRVLIMITKLYARILPPSEIWGKEAM